MAQLIMKIKPQSQTTTQMLWRESPCTLRCALNNPPFDQSQRFHYGSIYFKDEVNKPKKVFTEFEKPELLLLNFRRQIDEVTLHARKSSLKHSETAPTGQQTAKKSFKVTRPQQSSLYELPPKLDLRHDSFGNRSTYRGDYNVKELSSRVHNTKRNFFSSHRVDLSKPQNFYPGPGTYFQEPSPVPNARSTFSHRMRANSMPNAKKSHQLP